jgi:hypothetical protein
MKTLTIPPHVLTLVRDYGHNKAVAWLEGSDELAKPDDDLCSFLSRSDTEWDQLSTADQDLLRDVYIESVKTTMASRVSSPVTVEVPSGKPGGPATTRESLDRVHSDVPPLGEVRAETKSGDGILCFGTVFGDCGMVAAWEKGQRINFFVNGKDPLTFTKEQIPSLIAHLSAWLSTGSFSLTPPVSTKIDSGASYVDLSGDKWCPDCGRIGAHFCDKGQTSHPGWSADPPSPEKPVVQPTGSDLEFSDTDRLDYLMRFTVPSVDRAVLDKCIRSEKLNA